jgi:predicted dehydrogenase
MKDKTALLIVGLVRGGAWARDVVKTDDLTLAGVVELDGEKLARVGAELGVPEERRYLDFERALREAKPDIVVLAVPTPVHREMSLAALEAGHHLICEKPLVRSLDEARELRTAVMRYDRRFMVGENYRFSDGMENLHRAIAQGLIGRPIYIDHEFRRAGAGRPPGAQSAKGAPVDPHRGIPEMSVHHFDMWWYMTGKRPVEIRADPFSPPWENSGRTFGYSMRATLEDGTHVHYLTSRALSRPQTTWPGNVCVVGEQGTLTWDGSGGVVTLSRDLPTHDYRDQHLATGPVTFVSSGSGGVTFGPAGAGASSTMQMVRALVNAIREDRPHPNDIDDNWVSFATAMAAVESAQTGQPVKVATS